MPKYLPFAEAFLEWKQYKSLRTSFYLMFMARTVHALCLAHKACLLFSTIHTHALQYSCIWKAHIDRGYGSIFKTKQDHTGRECFHVIPLSLAGTYRLQPLSVVESNYLMGVNVPYSSEGKHMTDRREVTVEVIRHAQVYFIISQM